MPNIDVSTTLFSNGSDFKPKSSKASIGDTVTLISSGTTGKIKVYTYIKDNTNKWVLTRVFTKDHDPPYNSHPGNGNPFTLLSNISGKVLLSLSAPDELRAGPEDPLAGANGSLTVGTGDGDPK